MNNTDEILFLEEANNIISTESKEDFSLIGTKYPISFNEPPIEVWSGYVIEIREKTVVVEIQSNINKEILVAELSKDRLCELNNDQTNYKLGSYLEWRFYKNILKNHIYIESEVINTAIDATTQATIERFRRKDLELANEIRQN